MTAEDYKYIDIDGVSIAYTDRGAGKPILFIHGFGFFSYTWMRLIKHLPEGKFRTITIDLKGHGYSEIKIDDNLSLFDHALIVKKIIKRLNLDDIVLVGHSMGGTVSLLTLFDPDIKRRTSKLVLLNSAGYVKKLHSFLDIFTKSSERPKFKLAKEDLLALALLERVIYKKNKLTHEMIKEYGKVLRRKRAISCLVEMAKQCVLPDLNSFHKNISRIDIPALIIWGENDTILDIKYSTIFKNELPNVEFELIKECGHSPQEEKPKLVAEIIADFLGAYSGVEDFVEDLVGKGNPEISTLNSNIDNEGMVASSLDHIKRASTKYIHNIKMRRLVDRWSFGVLFMVSVLKLLQLLKMIGIRTRENGWRMLSGVFLRNEHSKFILASFRLKYHSLTNKPEDSDTAKKIIVDRLMDFLRSKPSCHWALEWSLFRTKRKRIFFTDIIEAKFDKDSKLQSIIPHFDNTRTTFTLLRPEIIQEALDRIVRVYNQNDEKKVEDHKRPWRIYKKLRRWIYRSMSLSFAGKSELCHLVERVLNGTFIQFELLDYAPNMITQKRLATPNLKRRRHPGFGLLNLVCRFTVDFNEADLWFQYHHVPVDGMPMQEMLKNLKDEWGEVAPIKYPALGSAAANPEIFYFGNKLLRARVYINFDKLLSVRKYLNARYYVEMGGFASVASMVVWGLAQAEYFKERKFLVPLDTDITSDYPQDRNISLIFIRPSRYFVDDNPLKGFLDYQREYNKRLFATKHGRSESYEVLELYAMIHPLICWGARYLIPKAMGEILGTAGLTILKDAEMFISPLTDLQFNGFAAVGNLRMPTEDGKTAGAISICSTKGEVREYIKAVYNLAEKYDEFLKIEV